MNPLLPAALSYVDRGWPVLPIYEMKHDGKCACGERGSTSCQKPGKHPRISNGLKDASTDREVIRSWWGRWPNANVGVVTGHVSGTVVLDIDPRNGGEDSLAKLEERHGTLPATLTAHTGGGGLHCFFRHPGHQKVPNRRDLGGLPGLDLKGDAAYIIAPPSNHASGSRYSWDEATNRENTLLVPCPEFLLRLAANSGVGGRVRYRNEAWDGSIPSRVEHILNEFEALYYAYNEAPALMAGLT